MLRLFQGAMSEAAIFALPLRRFNTYLDLFLEEQESDENKQRYSDPRDAKTPEQVDWAGYQKRRQAGDKSLRMPRKQDIAPFDWNNKQTVQSSISDTFRLVGRMKKARLKPHAYVALYKTMKGQ